MNQDLLLTDLSSRSSSRIRSDLARALECTPFEISMSPLAKGRAGSLYRLHSMPTVGTDSPLAGLPYPLSPLPRCFSRADSVWAPHFLNALEPVSRARFLPSRQLIHAGRPLVLSAELLPGRCLLDVFRLSDWKVFLFQSSLDLRLSHITHLWAQHWLADLCSHLGWSVNWRRGSPAFMVTSRSLSV